MSDYIKTEAITFNIEIGNTTFNVILDNSYVNTTNTDLSSKNIHFHSKYELFVLNDGKISIYLNEKKILTYQEAAILVPPLLNHYSIRTGDIYRILFSFSKKKTTKKITNTYNFFCNIFNSNAVKKLVLYNKSNYLDTISYLIQYKKEIKFTFEKIHHLLTLFFLDLIPPSILITEHSTTLLAANYVSQIENILFYHYNENITINQLSKILNLSVRQTSRILQLYFHKSFSTLITDKKMLVACQLLTESTKKITEIVDSLNFNSESYFFRLFKKYYGCTPLEYRKDRMKRQ